MAVLHQRHAIRYSASRMRNCQRGARSLMYVYVHSGSCAPHFIRSLRFMTLCIQCSKSKMPCSVSQCFVAHIYFCLVLQIFSSARPCSHLTDKQHHRKAVLQFAAKKIRHGDAPAILHTAINKNLKPRSSNPLF